ncbi:MAG: tetratricopeptide repeat protein, partial [Kofleriaceae bacterium]
PTLRDAPGWLDAAIRRCLAVDPARRFGSLAAVADHLAQRSQRRRPVAWIAGAAVAAVAASTATWLAARDGGAALAPCDGGAAEIAQVWSPARLAQLDGLADPSRAALDRWAAAWAAQRDASCRAARTDPAPRVAARDRCLDQRRTELAALLDQLVAAPPDAADRGARSDGRESARRAERLIDALAALPPSECAAAGPSTADALPLDPARAAIAREVQAQLVPVRAAIALGDARPFVEPTGALVDRARESGHAPTVAEAELARAEVLRVASRLGEAAVSARDAAAAAERGRDDLAAARAWIARVAIAGDRRDLAIAEDLAALAGAAVDRAGAPPRLSGQLLRLRGLVAFNRGQLDEARRLLGDARARFVEASGERSIEVASVESALGIVAREQDQLELAERHHRAALEISRVLRGPQHPEIARDLHNLAGVRRKLGDLEGAAANYRDALAIMIASRGPRSAEAGLTHNSLGLVHMARSDWAAARTELALARDALAAAGHGDRVFAEHNLGLVAARTGDHRTALAQFAIAAPLYAATLGADAPAAIQLQIDRARSAAALGERTEARGLATSAREAATRANLRYVIDESDALLADLAAAMRPGPVVARGPSRARRDLRAEPDPDAAPIRSISIEPPPALDRPVTQPTLVDVPPPPRPPVPAQAPQPQRDVGTYGSSQGW